MLGGFGRRAFGFLCDSFPRSLQVSVRPSSPTKSASVQTDFQSREGFVRLRQTPSGNVFVRWEAFRVSSFVLDPVSHPLTDGCGRDANRLRTESFCPVDTYSP